MVYLRKGTYRISEETRKACIPKNIIESVSVRNILKAVLRGSQGLGSDGAVAQQGTGTGMSDAAGTIQIEMQEIVSCWFLIFLLRYNVGQ